METFFAIQRFMLNNRIANVTLVVEAVVVVVVVAITEVVVRLIVVVH